MFGLFSSGNKRSSSRRTSSKRKTTSSPIPRGRTLTTSDQYLSGSRTGSSKTRPVVVIETNKRNELAVVPLSSRKGKSRTRLPNYQNGKSYYKHFVETEDSSGNPIKINSKFRANHKNMDVAPGDVAQIRTTVFKKSKQAQENNNKIRKFRK